MDYKETFNRFANSVKDHIENWRETKAFNQNFKEMNAKEVIEKNFDWIVMLSYLEENGQRAEVGFKFDVNQLGETFSQIDYLIDGGERFAFRQSDRIELFQILSQMAKRGIDVEEEKTFLVDYYTKKPEALDKLRDAIHSSYALLLSPYTTDMKFSKEGITIQHALQSEKEIIPLSFNFHGDGTDRVLPLTNVFSIALDDIAKKQKILESNTGVIMKNAEIPFEMIDDRNKFEKIQEDLGQKLDVALEKAKKALDATERFVRG